MPCVCCVLSRKIWSGYTKIGSQKYVAPLYQKWSVCTWCVHYTVVEAQQQITLVRCIVCRRKQQASDGSNEAYGQEQVKKMVVTI